MIILWTYQRRYDVQFKVLGFVFPSRFDDLVDTVADSTLLQSMLSVGFGIPLAFMLSVGVCNLSLITI